MSVITSIGIDHTPWLGTSLTSIAFEKAGIIRNRVPVVTGARGKALTVIKKVAEQKNSPLVCASERALWGGDGITLRCGLRGRHQVENARVAYRALETLDHPRLALTRRLIQQGFSKVHWPGRYEKFSLRKGGRSQWIILDGAHNPQAITALVQTLKEDRFSRVSLLFGALKDKDSKTMVRILFPLVHQGFIVPLPSDRSEDPCRIIPFWKGHKHVFPAPSIGAGWKKILAGPDRNPVVVTGSLYLVGAIRKKLTVRGRS